MERLDIEYPPMVGSSAQGSTELANPLAETEALSIEDLQIMLRDRDATISELEKEIARLEQAPRDVEARLAHLESLFGTMGPGDIVKTTPAVYSSVGHTIKDELSLQHEDPEEHHSSSKLDQQSGRPELASLESTNLVLGQGYLPLDQQYHNASAAPPPKPAYLAASHELPASQLFVGPGGSVERRQLQQLSPYQPFWLDDPAGV